MTGEKITLEKKMLKPQFPSTSLIALHRALKLQQAETYAVMENINISFEMLRNEHGRESWGITLTHVVDELPRYFV